MLLNPSTSAVQRIISLQYNPDTLTRTLQVQGIGGEGETVQKHYDSKAPVETKKMEAVADVADQLKFLNQDNQGGE